VAIMENGMNEMQDMKSRIVSEVETYVKSEYELARLQIIDKASHLVGSLLLVICIILIAFAVMASCAVAAVVALAQVVPTWLACLIVGVAYLLLIPILVVFAQGLFVNPIVKKLSGIRNCQELKCETLRAEGHAAVQRERMGFHVRAIQETFNRYSQLASMAWNFVRRLFKK